MNSFWKYWIGFGSIGMGIVIFIIIPEKNFVAVSLLIAGIIALISAVSLAGRESRVKEINNRLQTLYDKVTDEIVNDQSMLEVIEKYSDLEGIPKSLFYSSIIRNFGFSILKTIEKAILAGDKEHLNQLVHIISKTSEPLISLNLSHKKEILGLSFLDTIVYFNDTMKCSKSVEGRKENKVGLFFVTRTSLIFIATEVDITFLKKHYIFQRLMDRGLDGFKGLVGTAILDSAGKIKPSLNNVTLDTEYLNRLLEAYENFKVRIVLNDIKKINLGTSRSKRLFDPKIKITISDNECYEFESTNNSHDFLEDIELLLLGLTTVNKNPMLNFEGNNEFEVTSFFENWTNSSLE